MGDREYKLRKGIMRKKKGKKGIDTVKKGG
jgi:hypothetical protein